MTQYYYSGANQLFMVVLLTFTKRVQPTQVWVDFLLIFTFYTL